MKSSLAAASREPAVAEPALLAPALLVVSGTLLAVTILFSKLAAEAGMQMLWFLVAVMGGSGAVLIAVAMAAGTGCGLGRFLIYAMGAGVFAAVPTACGYLTVARVGAGFISFTMAFPVLLTFLLALALRMDRATPMKLAAVASALAGGLVLAFGKAAAPGGDAVAIAATSAIPVLLAIGNLYRTRFWPRDARPLPLAALTLLAAAALTLPVAVLVEGAPHSLAPNGGALTAAAVAVFAAQYAFHFRLQRAAGPVYMSQIGTVAAVTGAVMAVLLAGEALPPGFWAAAGLVLLGAGAFQIARSRAS
ncbi:MAG: hypothetical protein KF887_02980 [Paracoccaceae bacterium]|nr:MAG: hypothetical protein KF887_02980 [Paracoccaceae bacterium]